MLDGDAFGKEMVAVVRDYMAAELEPLRAENKSLLDRIDALEKREMPVPDGPDEEAIVRRVLAVIPPPPAIDPVEVDMVAVRALVGEMTQQAVSEQLAEAMKTIPVPKAPEPIAPDMEAISRLIHDEITRAVSELPLPAKGEPGIGLTSGLIDRAGDLILTLSNGETRNVGRVEGKDGKPGETFTLDDFDIVPLGERTIKMGFTKGDVMHSFELAFPVPVYRDVFKEAETYERGDMVTWAGAMWHCDEPKGLKPGVPDSGWTLAVKAGRPGKDAVK